jgi:SHS2 domain-containing protein
MSVYRRIMDRFAFLDHTADAKFEVFSSTKEGLFRQCALAMTAVMSDDPVAAKRQQKITLSASSTQALLFDFLNELLFLLEDEKLLAADIHDITLTDKTLSATVMGDDVASYETKTAIKAATYNDMVIEKTHDGWHAVVVVDI